MPVFLSIVDAAHRQESIGTPHRDRPDDRTDIPLYRHRRHGSGTDAGHQREVHHVSPDGASDDHHQAGQAKQRSLRQAAETKTFPPEIHSFGFRSEPRDHHSAGKQVTERSADTHSEDPGFPYTDQQNIQNGIGNDHHTDSEIAAFYIVVKRQEYHQHSRKHLADDPRRITGDIIRNQAGDVPLRAEQ